ncbi:acetate--CoA ligase family protein [Couchioplanes azureus]|uniref:acetate--CoA ligase family protein n=1 Tax=Couchioplanes caeruleus TaxID=56438 RepID=UPI001670966D|nr:acetate--CoA ligase [Couchioplanes caeruleus]GGQ75378.1 CoA-binding protein [Couchioplanes caeruleus subsp. azureus]
MSRDLRALFDPASVAIVGASDDPAKWGNAVARQALRAGGRRPVHLVNRRGGTILGRRAATSVAGLGEPVELVVVAVPAASFEAAVDDALAAGARAIVGITAGFAETGAAGRQRQEAVVARCRAAGALLVGPNCLGLVDNTTEVYLSSDRFGPGGVALLSQSGNLALELQLRLDRHGLGFSRFVSFGNQADVTLVDLVADCAAHPATGAVAVYAEDFGDGRAFASAAGRTGKPVVLLHAGGGEASARGARSHTGALTSSSEVVRAAARDAGIHLAETPRELATLLVALSGPRRAAGRRTVVVTDGGGHGAVAADVAERAGLSVPETGPALAGALRDQLWGPSAVGNPVDLAGMGEQDPRSYARTVATLLDASEVDAVLLTGFFGGYSAAADPGADTGGLGGGLAAGELAAARTLAEHAAAGATPVVVHSMYPESPTCAALRAGGVPVFDAVEDAARALTAVTGTAAPRGVPSLPAPAPAVTDVSYFAVRRLLAGAGVPFLPAREFSAPEELDGLFDGPYVLKAPHLLHKSDAGGVALRLADRAELTAAYHRMHRSLGAPSYSVEPMADLAGGVELIAGVRWDPRFGPVALVGVGGVSAEVLRDVVFALAPVSAGQARRLLLGLRSAPLLLGHRGAPPVDLGAAARAIAHLTQVAAAHPELTEIEVNPLLVTPTGALALDARAVVQEDR